MAEKMSLAQVRDWHRTEARFFEGAGVKRGSNKLHDEMADTIDAHLAQLAQAVDVKALNQLMAELTVYGSDSEQKIGDRIFCAIGNKGNGVA